MDVAAQQFDVVVIGGGFYGCAVALEMRRLGRRVLLLEKSAQLMQRASYVNQARIHQGYHYPRSVLTALRSRVNFERFIDEYAGCVFNSFDKYYAVGRIASKVNGEQFQRFCSRIGAPISKAPKEVVALFDPNLVEAVFAVREYAFDAVKLKNAMLAALQQAQVELAFNCDVGRVSRGGEQLRVELQNGNSGSAINAECVFNCTYSQINQVMSRSGLEQIPLKHELTEMALVRMPEPLAQMGFTIMDGPFFSVMPFPARGCHSLSHVRYTPHHYWQDEPGKAYNEHYSQTRNSAFASYYVHMLKDAQRYIPALAGCEYIDSLWEVKTVLPQSEVDDSRPILFKRCEQLPGLISIMGGKIDNIFDIREKLHELFSR